MFTLKRPQKLKRVNKILEPQREKLKIENLPGKRLITRNKNQIARNFLIRLSEPGNYPQLQISKRKGFRH